LNPTPLVRREIRAPDFSSKRESGRGKPSKSMFWEHLIAVEQDPIHTFGGTRRELQIWAVDYFQTMQIRD
jgi:hypothetical protein